MFFRDIWKHEFKSIRKHTCRDNLVSGNINSIQFADHGILCTSCSSVQCTPAVCMKCTTCAAWKVFCFATQLSYNALLLNFAGSIGKRTLLLPFLRFDNADILAMHLVVKQIRYISFARVGPSRPRDPRGKIQSIVVLCHSYGISMSRLSTIL